MIAADWNARADKAHDDLKRVAEALESLVSLYEPCDPWVKATFGIEGVCEGFVFVPHSCTYEEYSRYAFKVKGEKHKVTKNGQKVPVSIERAASAEAFAAMFVTEARCEQGCGTNGAGAHVVRDDPVGCGDFIRWMLLDVEKESAEERATSGLEWKACAAAVAKAARKWFLG